MRRREGWRRRRAWALIAAFLLGAGCGGSSGPPAIAIGTRCATCGMEARDLHFACERRSAGAWRVYDAIECLMRDADDAATATPSGTGETWLADYDTRSLHAADSVWVVRGAFASPMGGGLAAFLNRATADSTAAVTNGRVDRLATFMAETAGSAR